MFKIAVPFNTCFSVLHIYIIISYLCCIGFRAKPKLSIVELVLYNMAAMLAGVAAGYDVRLSNISPLHPRLQPNR